MNNYELDSSKVFTANLEAALAGLAAAWGVSSENNPSIEEVRKAAHFNVLGRTTLRLVRLANHSPFEEHRSFFEGLTAKDYIPHLYGTEIKQGSVQLAQAKKLLKDFANYVGHTVIREQDAKLAYAKTSAIKDPLWIESGLIPSDNGIVVTETDLSHEDIDWGAPTIPADLPQDDKSKFRDEKNRMTEIIKGASPSDVRLYLQNTLRPRFAEVLNELKDRREKYGSQTSFELKEGVLIDFKASLIVIMQQALDKLAPPRIVIKQEATQQPAQATVVAAVNENVAPYPILVSDEEPAAVAKPVEAPPQVAKASKSTLPANFAEELRKLRNRVNGYVADATGDNLISLHATKLLPKIAEIEEKIAALKASSNDPVKLLIATQHLIVIKSSAADAQRKINDEAAVTATAKTEIAPVAVPVAVVAPITARRPASAFAFLPTLTEEIAVGNLRKAKDAFIGATQQDAAFAKFMASVVPEPAAQSSAVALVVAVEPQSEPVAEPAARTTNRPSLLSKNKDNAQTVRFKDFDPAPAAKIGPSFGDRITALREKAKRGLEYVAGGAIIAGAITALGGVAIAIGLHAGFAVRDSNNLDKALAEAVATSASAKADFNKAQENVIAPNVFVQPTLVVVSPPANDVSVKTDAQPVVDRTLAEEEAFQARTAKAEAEKVKTASKAKADFRPAAAANDAKVTYQDAIVAKPFDIATSRVGLDTLNNACGFLKANNTLVKDGVCPINPERSFN